MTSDKIKQIRTLLGITQNELAKMIGVSLRTITNYEKGGVIPANKRDLLNKLLTDAHNTTINNTGSVNYGSAGGHLANIYVPGGMSTKIINDEGIKAMCDPVSVHESQQSYTSLENEVKMLREELASLNRKYIKLLEEKAGLKDK